MESEMTNAIARKYFLHDNDRDDNDVLACFFSNGLDEDGWGFWVAPDGTVDVDTASSNGDLPSHRVVDACVRSAVKYLSNRK